MTPDEIVKLVESATLGWFPMKVWFRVRLDDFDRLTREPRNIYIALEVETKDTSTGQPTRIMRPCNLPTSDAETMTEEKFAEWLFEVVVLPMFRHELMEAYKIGGKHPYDPHSDDD